MSDSEEEDQLLESVALQNAQAIVAARRKAERELAEAKEALAQKAEELAQQREWFSVTLASIGDAVVTTDTSANITFLNSVAESLTGWAAREACGQPLDKVFVLIDERTRLPAHNPVLAALRDGMTVAMANHTSLIARDGTEKPIEDSAAPIRDSQGDIIGAIMVFHDVTTRRRAEADLRRNEQLLSDFFENAAVALHWVGSDGAILRANRTELEMLGYVRDEYVGRNIADFYVDSSVAGDVLGRLNAGHELREYEAQLRCKDGSVKDVAISSNVLREHGRFVHTRCFTRDITEIKERRHCRSALRP